MKLTRTLHTCLWLPAMVLLATCATNPVTGNRELALISEQQEIEMGREAAGQFSEALGLVDNESLQAYVSSVGMPLARSSERPDLPWEFHVVDDPVPNAFALPGGYIFVTRGLLALMDSEAELAAVLGHEIGHVTARHSVSQLSRAQLAQLGLGLGMILAPAEARGLGELANTGLSLLFLKHGRDDERQADELGFRYMLEHDYDVREMDDVFIALQAASEKESGGDVPSWMATHPSPPERIERTRQRVDELESLPDNAKVRSDRFLSELDGMLYGNDPRVGYFEDGMFFHPDLAFKFAVPADWQKRNSPSAVSAASPEGRAALQFTLASPDTRTAVASFVQSEAVQEINTQETRLNGQPAWITTFAAASQGGPVRGLAAHIALNERSYRLVAFAPEQLWDAQRPLLREIITSFAPVNDSSVLDKQPERIDVVTLDRRMSLAEFHRRYPSSIPMKELALINQVAGEDTTFSAGSRLKRVR